MSHFVNAWVNLSRTEQTRLQRHQIEQERMQRIAAHKQAIAAHRAKLALAPGMPSPLNFFADGDSWFDYPLPVLAPNDVISSIRKNGSPQPFLLNLAHYGDEARDNLGVQQRQRIRDNLQDPDNGTFDAILFSGGGNDTVGNQFCLWIENYVAGMTPKQGINVPRLDAVLGVVRSAYEDLIAVRDQFAPQCPIFIHGYDFAIPTGLGICDNTIGPWLQPSLEYRGWMDMPTATQVVKEFLLQFRQMLVDLAAAHKPDVIYVETQGTLDPKEWANELHPTPRGFDQIAEKFLLALRKKFGKRI
jgi:hypothetical protein